MIIKKCPKDSNYNLTNLLFNCFDLFHCTLAANSIIAQLRAHSALKMHSPNDEISIDDQQYVSSSSGSSIAAANTLKYLPRWPPVNIEFQDVVYTVPDLSGKPTIYPNNTR